MKLFDFFCETCRHKWEYLVRDEDYPTTCPECEAKTISKILGGVITKLNSPEAVKASLEKRSIEHSGRELTKIASHTGKIPANKLGKPGFRAGDN